MLGGLHAQERPHPIFEKSLLKQRLVGRRYHFEMGTGTLGSELECASMAGLKSIVQVSFIIQTETFAPEVGSRHCFGTTALVGALVVETAVMSIGIEQDVMHAFAFSSYAYLPARNTRSIGPLHVPELASCLLPKEKHHAELTAQQLHLLHT